MRIWGKRKAIFNYSSTNLRIIFHWISFFGSKTQMMERIYYKDGKEMLH